MKKLILCAAILLFPLTMNIAHAKTETICIVKPGSAIAINEEDLKFIYSKCGENAYDWYFTVMLKGSPGNEIAIDEETKENYAWLKPKTNSLEVYFIPEQGSSIPGPKGKQKSDLNMTVYIMSRKEMWARKKDVLCKDFEYVPLQY
ncbi:hypothetical protein [Oceanidesulfovibrio marinus]|uniref:hypothetical protein n=1 Tax=Oceanidesulfovibrio marinus TaxID=370038 RepID=UPI0011846481|nr:hypothetical protein [Oceanidesulfovibrio marinus]